MTAAAVGTHGQVLVIGLSPVAASLTDSTMQKARQLPTLLWTTSMPRLAQYVGGLPCIPATPGPSVMQLTVSAANWKGAH